MLLQSIMRLLWYKCFFSKWGFCKGFITQHALPVMIEVWKIPVRTKNFARLFSLIYQKLLTVSVTISSFQNLTLVDSIEMHWNLSMITFVIHYHRSSFSACLDIIYDVPEGSILGLLLFNPLQDGGSEGSWEQGTVTSANLGISL